MSLAQPRDLYDFPLLPVLNWRNSREEEATRPLTLTGKHSKNMLTVSIERLIISQRLWDPCFSSFLCFPYVLVIPFLVVCFANLAELMAPDGRSIDAFEGVASLTNLC